MAWLVNIVGILLLVFIIWWFWMSRPKVIRPTDDVIQITLADGVYEPSHIEIPKGRNVILRFLRLDPSSCAETLLFEDLGIRLELPINQYRDLHLYVETAGNYSFSCDMNMYHGMLVVK